jgi:hypothetical protein
VAARECGYLPAEIFEFTAFAIVYSGVGGEPPVGIAAYWVMNAVRIAAYLPLVVVNTMLLIVLEPVAKAQLEAGNPTMVSIGEHLYPSMPNCLTVVL